MPNTFLTPTKIVRTALGLLVREVTLPRLIWRDAVGDFAGAKDDTISIHLPAYAPARTRDLRSGATRVRDSLAERKVDVTLDTDVYKDIRISDEELTLDIADFGAQVLRPAMQGIIQALEDEVAEEMQSATYATEISFDAGSDDFWDDVLIPAREALNKANIPQNERALALGSELESAALKTDMFVKANESGSNDALSDATLGRKAGFTVVSVPGLAPNKGYAFHKTAYVMNQRAPKVPAGAAFGAVESFQGFALRVVRTLDSATIEDILALDAWVGVNHVTDEGYFTADGVFVPSSIALGDVVTLAMSESDDDIIDTATAHGFVAGDEVVFTALTGGDGLVVGQVYYVVATSLAAQTFRVSDTPGGAAIGFTADITAGTVRKGGMAHMVRAVEITGS